MSRVLFPCPKPTEQGEITRRLDHAEAEIYALQNYAEKLQYQKLGLMQDLLTGKVAVKVNAQAPELVDG